MAISANLSLIPYSVDNYQLKPLSQQDLFPDHQQGRQAVKQHDRLRYSSFNKYSIHADSHNITYSSRLGMESSKIDLLGLLIDIYV